MVDNYRLLPVKQRELKLLIPDMEGKHFQEYIPGDYNKLSYKLHDLYLRFRVKFGLKIYYWHIRHYFLPHERKLYDIDFMLHFTHHDEDNPAEEIEHQHYRLARQLYGKEIDMIKELDLENWGVDDSKDIRLQKDKYLIAYKQKWLDNFDAGPEWRRLYHGVGPLDVADVSLMLKDLYVKRLEIIEEYSKELVKKEAKKQSNKQ